MKAHELYTYKDNIKHAPTTTREFAEILFLKERVEQLEENLKDLDVKLIRGKKHGSK